MFERKAKLTCSFLSILAFPIKRNLRICFTSPCVDVLNEKQCKYEEWDLASENYFGCYQRWVV